MNFTTKSGNLSKLGSGCLVLGIHGRKHLSEAAKAVDAASDGHLTRMLKAAHMDGDEEQTLMLHQVHGVACAQVLLVGCGKSKGYDLAAYRRVTAAALAELGRQRVGEALWTLHQPAPAATDSYSCVRDTVLSAESSTTPSQ